MFIEKKLIVCFYQDLEGLEPELVKLATAENGALLALDESVVRFATQHHIKYHRIAEILSAYEVNYTHLYAIYNKFRWFYERRDLFSTCNICWPFIDFGFIEGVWKDTVFAMLLAERLVELGVEELCLVKSYKKQVYSIFAYGDGWKNVLKVHFENTLNSNSVFFQESLKDFIKLFPEISSLKVLPKKFLEIIPYSEELLKKQRTNVNNLNKRSIYLILSDWEVNRNKHHIQELHNKFGKRFCLYIINGNIEYCKKIVGDDVKLIDYPIEEILYQEPKRSPFQQAKKWLFQRIDEDMYGCEALKIQFDYLLSNRWPNLITIYNKWYELFQTTNPALVINNLRFSAFYRLPIEIARQMDIECIGTPDAPFGADYNNYSNEHVFVDNKMDKEIYPVNCMPYEKVHLCKNVFPANTYHTQDVSHFIGHGLKIVVLLPSVWLAGQTSTLFATANSQGEVEVVRELINVPDDLKKDVELVFKGHPGMNDVPKYLSTIPSQMFLEPNVNLINLLDKADLLIEINYSSISAVLNGIKKDVPIFFICHKSINSSFDQQLVLPAGDVITRLEDIWTSIRRFKDDPSYRNTLKQKGITFKEKYLTLEDETPTFAELCEKIINNKKMGEEDTAILHKHIIDPLKSEEVEKNVIDPQIKELKVNNIFFYKGYQRFVCQDESNEDVVLQRKYANTGQRTDLSPFDPMFLSHNIEEFLALKRGFNKKLELYWRIKVEGTELIKYDNSTLLNQALPNILNKLCQSQKNSVTTSDRACIKLQNQTFDMVSKWEQIGKFFPQEYFESYLPCSWSHGNLEFSNIFYKENGIFKLDNWEWGTECAPFGIDAIDMYFHYCFERKHLSLEASLGHLNSSDDKDISSIISLINALYFKDFSIEPALLYWLIRYAAQLVAKDCNSDVLYIKKIIEDFI